MLKPDRFSCSQKIRLKWDPPVLDMNEKADSYTWIRIDKPYIALNPDTYISIRMEELRTW